MKMNPPNGKVITDYFLHNSSSSQETYFLHNSSSSQETYLNDPDADKV